MAVPDHAAQNERFGLEFDVESLERAPLDTMPYGSFTSSNVHSALYDFSERELFARYLREGPDAIYVYMNVPAQIWSGLVEADSKGSFINRSIAFEYTYKKAGRDDFPERGAIRSDILTRFVYDP